MDHEGSKPGIHGHIIPSEGWTAERPALRHEEMEELLGLVQGECPAARLDLLRRFLPHVFADAVRIQGIGKPDGKKPATHIREEIDALLKGLWAAEKRLHGLDPLAAQFLDSQLTALNAGSAPGDDGPSFYTMRDELLDRVAVLIAICERVKPATKTAGETGWAFSALALARLLREATGEPLRRSYSASKGTDDYWSLELFQRFAAMVQEHVPEERRTKSWGKAEFSGIWGQAREEANRERG